jgi:hypothetical protein
MYLNQRTTLKPLADDLDPNPTIVVPNGLYGAGLWTAHPIGLFIASGLVLVGLLGLPEARWFFAATFPLGGLWGYLLWRSHNKPLVRPALNLVGPHQQS